MSNPFLDAINGTQAKPAPAPAPQQKASSGNPFLDAINGGSQPKVSQVTQSKATPVAKPTQFTAPSGGIKIGENKWKTISGSTWEYKPDGTRVITLAPQFGGGSYSVNPNDVNKVINSGHTDYAGEQAQKGKQRDDIIPVGLGGNNSSPDNIRFENLVRGGGTSTDPIEKKAINDYKSGKISLAQARLQVMTTKQNQTNGAPKPGVLNNLGSGLKDATGFAVGQGAGFFTQNLKGLVDPIVHPGTTEQNIEKSVKGGNPILDPIAKYATRLASPITVPIAEGSQKLAGDIADIENNYPGKLDPKLYQKLVTASKANTPAGEKARMMLQTQLQAAHSKYDETIPGIRNEDIPFIMNEGTAVTGLYDIAAPIAKSAVLKLANYADGSTLELTHKDLANIHAGRENLVDPAKVDAYKSAIKTEVYKQIKETGKFTVDSNTPTTVGNFLRNAATKPLSEIMSFAKASENYVRNAKQLPAPGEPPVVKPVEFEAPADIAPKEVTIPQKNYQLVEAPKTSYQPVTTPLPPHMEVRTPELVHKPITNAVKVSTPTPIKTTKPKVAEAGFAAPGQAVTDIKDFINKTSKGIDSSKNLENDLYKIKQNSQADKLEAVKILKKLNVSAKDSEAIYHFEENKSIKLTDTQKAIYDNYVKPLADASQKLAEKLKPTGLMTSDSYTPRYVAGKGGAMDKLKAASEDSFASVKGGVGKNGLLNRSAASLKHRTMKVIIDAQGNRTVVAIKKGRVTSFVDKKTTDLGQFKQRSNADLLEKEVKPLQKKLDEVQKMLDGIDKINVKNPVTKARLKAVEAKLSSLLEKAYGLSDETGTGMTPQMKRKAALIIKELKTLESIKEGDKLTNIASRIKTLQSKMVELSNAIAEIESKYNPDELNNKKFIAKREAGGGEYKIAEATTKEIEQHTNITYHKNAVVNRLVNYLDLQQKARAVDFLENLKASSEFKDIAVKFDEGIPPKGWRPTKLQQFMGYNFEPHVAATLDRFAGDLNASKKNVFSAINSFMRSAIFFNPLIHVPNIGVHWAVNRGVTPFLNPMAYPKFIESTTKAINAVIHQNADYVDMLRSGAPLVYGNENVSQLNDLLVKKLTTDLENPQFSKIKDLLGNINIYKLSGKATWLVNDVATMQAVYEEMGHGLTMDEAINEVGKHIPNYRVPSTVLNSEALSKALTNPNLTMFGGYHYGALNSYYEMAKTLVDANGKTGSAGAKERAKILDKLMMMAIIGLVIYPFLDKLAQKITKNSSSKFGRAGAITFPYNTYKLAKGQMQWFDYLSSIMTPSVGTRELAQLALNKDLRTGQPIVNGSFSQDPKASGKEIGNDLIKTIAPLDKATQIKSGKLSVKDFMLSLIRVSNPKSSDATKSAQEQIYSEKPIVVKQVKALYEAGRVDEANELIKDYNNRLLQNLVQASVDAKNPLSPDDIKKQASKDFISPPSAKVQQNYKANQTKSNFQKLLNPVTVPKKTNSRSRSSGRTTKSKTTTSTPIF